MTGRSFAAALICVGLSAQTAAPPAGSTTVPQGNANPESFRAQTTEVIVPITVTDEKGRFVSNLDARDFKIFDEGKQQKIQFFTRERNQPVVIGFLLDLSNASRIHWKAYSESTQELVTALLPNDPKYSGYL